MKGCYRVLGLGVFGVALLAFDPLMGIAPRIVFNGSGSAPTGIYRARSNIVEVGDLVLMRLPESVQNLVSARGYLPPMVPVIKRIVAGPGDEICRQNAAVFVNGKRVATALAHDGLGRPMPVWRGCRVLREHDFLLLQDHPRSFDGRYFDAVDGSLIIGELEPLWLFDE